MPRPNVEIERREQILEAACQVIADIGYTQLRVADVAKAAGLSSGSVHYYFANKQALIKAAFEFNFRHSLESRRLLLSSGQDPITMLSKLVDSYSPSRPESLQAWRVWAALWVEGIRDADLQLLNDTLYGEWRQLVVDLIAKAQAEGLARSGNTIDMANMLLGMIDGLAVQVLTKSEQMTLPRMRALLRIFVRDVIAVPDAPALGATEVDSPATASG